MSLKQRRVKKTTTTALTMIIKFALPGPGSFVRLWRELFMRTFIREMRHVWEANHGHPKTGLCRKCASEPVHAHASQGSPGRPRG